jgi:transcriptional regulator with XRE-family HTH domain
MTPPELRIIRRRLGWTQDQAATRLGVSGRSYRYTEQGRNSHGKPVGVPPLVAVAMLGFALATDIEAPVWISRARLVEFCRAVHREANGEPQ